MLLSYRAVSSFRSAPQTSLSNGLLPYTHTMAYLVFFIIHTMQSFKHHHFILSCQNHDTFSFPFAPHHLKLLISLPLCQTRPTHTVQLPCVPHHAKLQSSLPFYLLYNSLFYEQHNAKRHFMSHTMQSVIHNFHSLSY